MTQSLPLRLALALALSAFAAGAFAQDALDAVEPAEVDAVEQNEAPEATVPSTQDTVAIAEGEAVDDADDRRCLQYTGSRVSADPVPQTDGGATERADTDDARRCANATGTVHTREDLERTGATNLEDALRAVEPRVF